MKKEGYDLFLEILAEEAVKQAYESEILTSRILEADDGEEKEDPLFGGDDDDGDDESQDMPDMSGKGDDGEPEEDPMMDMGSEEKPEEPKKDQVEVRPTPLTLELGEITSDGLLATLNMIRAGRSFKEADVAGEMKKYFEEQLNDSEKLALATFLSAIKDLTSGTPAEDAPEPGDENININATDAEMADQTAPERGASRPALRQDQQQQQSQQPQQVQVQGQEEPPRGLEDTSPPIQVGPRNSRLAESYREQIRSILIK